jgi:hypothetical protein
MTQDAQAQADLETTQTGEDLETDAAHDPIDGATNLKDYDALLEESLKPQADAVEEEELDPEEAEEDIGNGEEPETEEAETPEEEAPEDTVEDEGKPQERFRIRAANEVEATALLLKKQNPGWSLEECLSKSKTIHDAPEDHTEDATADAESPKTVAEVRSRIDALRQAKAEAYETLEFAEVARLDLEIDTLRDALDEIKEQEIRKEQLLEMEFNQAVEHSQNKAVSIYPDTTKADSPLVKRMLEIDRQMKDDGNPLYFSPDKPFKLAQMAANDIGIAPRNPKSAATPARPMVKSRTVQPASGNARTTAPTSPTDKIDQAVDQVSDIASYDALLAKIAS